MSADARTISGWKLGLLMLGAGVVGGAVGCVVFVGLVFFAFLSGLLPD